MFVHLLAQSLTYFSIKHLSNNLPTCGKLFYVFSTCMKFNASINQYQKIILVSKSRYPSRCGQVDKLTRKVEFDHLLIHSLTYLSMKHLSNNLTTCVKLFFVSALAWISMPPFIYIKESSLSPSCFQADMDT